MGESTLSAERPAPDFLDHGKTSGRPRSTGSAPRDIVEAHLTEAALGAPALGRADQGLQHAGAAGAGTNVDRRDVAVPVRVQQRGIECFHTPEDTDDDTRRFGEEYYFVWRSQLRAKDVMRALASVGAQSPVHRMIGVLAKQREAELDDDGEIGKGGATDGKSGARGRRDVVGLTRHRRPAWRA
jgi:hypothetical protein